MRIGIDARLILEETRGGGQYTYNLIKSLLEIDQENQYVLFYNFVRQAKNRKEIIKTFSHLNVENRVYRIPGDILDFFWDKFRLPSLDRMLGKVDLFHSPFCADIPPLNCRWVAGIFQVTPERLRPLEYNWLGRKKFYQMLERLPQKATFIITASNSTKNDLVEGFKFPEEKIRVIPLAASVIFHPLEDKVSVRKQLTFYGINERYILYTGSASWNKNLSRLIDAFGQVKKRLKVKHKLVFAGRRSWGYDKILTEIAEKGLNNEIIFIDYPSQENLVYFYNAAEFFIYPSLWEGFGLSALEAIACGTPLAASDISVFREVIGEAGFFFNPEDTEAMSQAMIRLIEDENLRMHLREEGLEQAKFFSWKKTAQETLSVYKEAVEI